jgi:heptosyltransferase I
MSQERKNVCIVLLTGLGDVVHGLPIANALVDSGFARSITWVAEPVPARVLEAHPSVHNIVVYHKKQGWAGVRQLARDLRGRFEVTLNLNVYFKSVWPTVLSRAPRRIGFDKARSHEGVWLFSNEHLRPNPRAHTQDMFLEFLDVLGVERRALEWRITFTDAERAAQKAWSARSGQKPVIALVPASANPKKDWLPDRYAHLIDALASDFGTQPVVVGGPSARERELVEQIRAAARSPFAVELNDDVRRMMWLIAGSSLVIAPDTGPVHVARACNVPVVGLYGHTNPWRVGPYRKYEDLWVDRYTEPGAEPDASNATPKLGRMELITVADVLSRVQRAYDERLITTGK